MPGSIAIVFPITNCGITHWEHLGLGSIAGATESELAMKHHFIILGCFLLLAVLGFALDVGITAMLLSHS